MVCSQTKLVQSDKTGTLLGMPGSLGIRPRTICSAHARPWPQGAGWGLSIIGPAGKRETQAGRAIISHQWMGHGLGQGSGQAPLHLCDANSQPHPLQGLAQGGTATSNSCSLTPRRSQNLHRQLPACPQQKPAGRTAAQHSTAAQPAQHSTASTAQPAKQPAQHRQHSIDSTATQLSRTQQPTQPRTLLGTPPPHTEAPQQKAATILASSTPQRPPSLPVPLNGDQGLPSHGVAQIWHEEDMILTPTWGHSMYI
jgi:hypothetical protein